MLLPRYWLPDNPWRTILFAGQMDSLADAIAGRALLRDMLCPLTGLQPPALGTVAALERLGVIKTKRTTVERLASLVLLSGRDYCRSCGGYITKVFWLSKYLRLPACYSGISGSLRQTEIFHGAYAGCLTCFTYRQALHLCFCLRCGAFHGISVTAMLAKFCCTGSHL